MHRTSVISVLIVINPPEEAAAHTRMNCGKINDNEINDEGADERSVCVTLALVYVFEKLEMICASVERRIFTSARSPERTNERAWCRYIDEQHGVCSSPHRKHVTTDVLIL